MYYGVYYLPIQFKLGLFMYALVIYLICMQLVRYRHYCLARKRQKNRLTERNKKYIFRKVYKTKLTDFSFNPSDADMKVVRKLELRVAEIILVTWVGATSLFFFFPPIMDVYDVTFTTPTIIEMSPVVDKKVIEKDDKQVAAYIYFKTPQESKKRMHVQNAQVFNDMSLGVAYQVVYYPKSNQIIAVYDGWEYQN